MTGAVVLAAEIGDPEATRTVIAIVVLLCVMGIALIMLAFWLRRVTRPDPELLAPLELMGERSWRRGDPVGQRRRLDEVRPEGAEPLTRAAAPPRFDEAFDEGPSAPGFDDLQPESDADRVETVRGSTPPGGHARPDGESDDAPGEILAADEAEQHDASDPDADDPDRNEPDADGPDADDPDHEGPADRDAAADRLDPVGGPDTYSEGADTGDADDDEPSSRTPVSTTRPLLDDVLGDLADGDIDPELLARAQAELDAELQRGTTES